jgi:hypothetical protein
MSSIPKNLIYIKAGSTTGMSRRFGRVEGLVYDPKAKVEDQIYCPDPDSKNMIATQDGGQMSWSIAGHWITKDRDLVVDKPEGLIEFPANIRRQRQYHIDINDQIPAWRLFPENPGTLPELTLFVGAMDATPGARTPDGRIIKLIFRLFCIDKGQLWWIDGLARVGHRGPMPLAYAAVPSITQNSTFEGTKGR